MLGQCVSSKTNVPFWHTTQCSEAEPQLSHSIDLTIYVVTTSKAVQLETS